MLALIAIVIISAMVVLVVVVGLYIFMVVVVLGKLIVQVGKWVDVVGNIVNYWLFVVIPCSLLASADMARMAMFPKLG